MMQSISNKKLWIVFRALLIVNSIFIVVLASKNGAYNLDGSYSEANSLGLIVTALMAVVFTIPLLLLLLSALFAVFIIYKANTEALGIFSLKKG